MEVLNNWPVSALPSHLRLFAKHIDRPICHSYFAPRYGRRCFRIDGRRAAVDLARMSLSRFGTRKGLAVSVSLRAPKTKHRPEMGMHSLFMANCRARRSRWQPVISLFAIGLCCAEVIGYIFDTHALRRMQRRSAETLMTSCRASQKRSNWNRQPPRSVFAASLGDSLLPRFVLASFPAAAAQFCVRQLGSCGAARLPQHRLQTIGAPSTHCRCAPCAAPASPPLSSPADPVPRRDSVCCQTDLFLAWRATRAAPAADPSTRPNSAPRARLRGLLGRLGWREGNARSTSSTWKERELSRF